MVEILYQPCNTLKLMESKQKNHILILLEQLEKLEHANIMKVTLYIKMNLYGLLNPKTPLI